MTTLEISLTYDPDHFREIYYANNNDNVFTSGITRQATLLLTVFTGITLLIYGISLRFSNLSWLIVMGVLISACCFIYFLYSINEYFKWKRNVERFIKSFQKYTSYRISLTEK